MSSLRSQLRKQSANANLRGRIFSYMYDAQVAGTRTIDEIYGLGLNGLLQLSQCDSRFNAYKDTVFSVANKGVPPESHTVEELSELDRSITSLCYLMGPFFLQRSTESAEGGSGSNSERVTGSVPKIIEYLIRNFGANLREGTVDALMACALPYHETAAFGRLLAVLLLNGKWDWLRTLSKAARPVSVEAFAAQCRTDKTLLRWVAETTRAMHEQGLLSRQFALFCAAVATGVLSGNSTGSVGKRTVETLLPLIIDGLRARRGSASAAAGEEPGERNIGLIAELVCAQLGKYTNFTGKTLANLAAMAIRGADAKNFGTRGLTVVSMLENQRAVYGTSAVLPASALARFLALREQWLELLASLAKRGVAIASFTTTVFDMVLRHGIIPAAAAKTEENEEMNDDNENNANGNESAAAAAACWEFVKGVVTDIEPLGKNVAFHIARSLLLKLFEDEKMQHLRKACEKDARSVLVLLSTRHPAALDKAIDAALKEDSEDNSNNKKKGWLFEFLGTTFSGTVHQPLPTGQVLALAVNHPLAAVRESAMDRIAEMQDVCASSPEFREFVLGAILERLRDEEAPEVLSKALALTWAIPQNGEAPSSSSLKVREIFDTLVDKTFADKKLTSAAVELAVALLGAAFTALAASSAEDCSALGLRVICAFWPHFLQRNSLDEAFVRSCSSLSGTTHFFFERFRASATGAATATPKSNRRRKSVAPVPMVQEGPVDAAQIVANTLLSDTDSMLPIIDATFSSTTITAAATSTMGKLFSLIVLTKALASASSSVPSVSVKLSECLLKHVSSELDTLFASVTKVPESAEPVKPEETSAAIASICAQSKAQHPLLPVTILVSILSLVLNAVPSHNITSASNDEEESRIGGIYRSVFCLAARLPLSLAAPVVKDLVFSRVKGDKSSIAPYRFLVSVLVQRGAGQQAQIRALNVISAALNAQGSLPGDVGRLVLPYALVAVQSPRKFVRNAALTLIGVAAAKGRLQKGSNSVDAFLGAVACAFDSARVELLAEVDFFTGICAQIATGKSFSGADVARADVTKFAALLADEAASAATTASDYSVARLLLVPAAALSSETTLEHVHAAGLLTNAVGGASSTVGGGSSAGDVVRLILGLYGAGRGTWELVNRSPAVLDPFLAVMSESGRASAMFCKDAIARVSGEFWAGLSDANKERVLRRLVEMASLGRDITAKVAARDCLRMLAPLPPALLEPYLAVSAEDDGRTLAQVDTVLEAVADRAGDWNGFCRHLVKRIFDVIRAIVDTPASSAREYTLQITLTTLALVTASLADAVRNGTLESAGGDTEVASSSVSTAAAEASKKKKTTAGGLPPRIVSSKKRAAAAKELKEHSEYEEYYDIALVTRCMRTATSPQVHVQSLSLLAAAAPLIPQAIMRNVVEILSFIATSAMTQDDSATFSVLGKTIEAIVPPMLSCAGAGAAPLVRTLVGGFATIPQHRRLLLFQTVVNTISPDSLGFICIALLHLSVAATATANAAASPEGEESSMDVEASAVGAAAGVDKKEEEASVVLAFAHKLCLAFAPECAVVALNELVSFALAFAKGEPLARWAPYYEDPSKGGSGSKDVIPQLARACLSFVESHVGGREFVEAVVTESDAERAAAEPQFLALFENVVRVINEASKMKAALGGGSSGIVSTARNALSALKNALSVPTFAKAVSRLLQSPGEAARRTGLLLLNEKLGDISGAIRDSEAALFTAEDGLLGLVVRMLGKAQSATSRQTALLTLEILARSLASRYPDAFEPLLGSAVEALDDPDDNVVSSALLCVATFVSELRAMSVAHLPRFMPAVLRRLRSALTGTSSSSSSSSSSSDGTSAAAVNANAGASGDVGGGVGDERLMSTLSALMVIVRRVADFLSPYAAQVMTLLLHPALVGSAGGRAAAVASQVLEALTENVEARLLLGPIFEVFASKAVTSAASLVRLFDVVREVSARMKPQAVATHYKHLLKFFLDGAFDFRDRYADTFDAGDMKLVEDHIIDAFLQLVMKLNENMFKPLFLKVNDFFQQKSARRRAHGEQFGPAERDAAIFYTRILKALAENLRGIFVPFFGFFTDYLLDHLAARDSADFVRANTDTMTSSMTSSAKQMRRKRQHEEMELDALQEKEAELDAAALDTLTLGFTYDTQGFADSAFSKLAAVGDQLENYPLGTERYAALMADNLTPCLAQLAAALGRNKKECWKVLNHQLLLHLRNDAPDVRRATLQTLTAIWQKIGEEIDVVLPETVPYLSEALQDSSAEVEAAANDFAEVIQSYLGEESLRDYF